jgi:Oxidoreductase family, NAD-binding Rossmann fold
MTTTDPQPPPVHVVVPPLDDTSISLISSLDCPPLRWAILGCGRVSHDFCLALRHVPTAQVVACAARGHRKRAQEFADKHGIAKVHGGDDAYDQLLLANNANDADVDIVYIGNVHAFRRTDVAKCIQAGKHVLVEKPFACTAADAKYLIDLAREKNVFIMEGMWTRFFPAVEHVRAALLCLFVRVVVSVVSKLAACKFGANSKKTDLSYSFPFLIVNAILILGPAHRFWEFGRQG